MSEQWQGKVCPECFEGTLIHGAKRVDFAYRNRTLTYEQTGSWCDRCGEGVVSGSEAEANEKVLDVFMMSVDREEAAELGRIRKKLKLTQKDASVITGGGHNAFSRYERGEARPLPAVVKLLRLLDRHPELLKEIRAA
jgi:HTH-type transcriptional regulator / antitoxin MqsA